MSHQRCPHCQVEQDVQGFHPGQRVRCACCSSTFRVHDPSQPRSAPVASPQAGLQVRRMEASPDLRTRPVQAMPGPRRAASSQPDRKPQLQQVAPAQLLPAERKPAPRRPNVTIEGYDISECLGKGGMGQVYKAIQRSLGRTVAIKTLDASLARNTASVTRFRKEAAAMAKLHHPNIVYVIDSGTYRQRHYFVMEFVDGPSLRELLNEGPFAPQEALQIMLQLVRTMEYAHSHGVIHRDLKPENLLYERESGTLKVADFGLAGVTQKNTHIHQLTGDKGLTRSFVSMGTECYMAPEQRRDAKHVDHRADMYSMGVIFFELLTGQLPFPHLPGPDQVIAKGYPKVDDIVRRCLHTSPLKRYETTAEMRVALEAVIDEMEAANQSQVVMSRDTVIDEAVSPAQLDLGSRLNDWPDKIKESFSDARSNISISWRRGHLRQMMWSALVLFCIAAAVGLFFFISPSPPVPGASKHKGGLFPWQKLPAPVTSLGAQGSKLDFDFNPRAWKAPWGIRPRQVWKLNGNWEAKGKMIEQNTYAHAFVVNQRNCWAQYKHKAHTLPAEGVSFSAKTQFLQSFVPVSKHRRVSLQQYIRQNRLQRSKVLHRTVGIGLRGKRGAEIALMVRPHNRSLRYILRIRGESNGRRRKFRTWEGDLPARFGALHSLRFTLKIKGGMLTAQINGHDIQQRPLRSHERFSNHPGLLCRDAHCRFSDITLHTKKTL